jgi:hypothetical protein
MLPEGRGRLAAALAASGMTGRPRARALTASGALVARAEEPAAGIAELDAAVAMWRELGDAAELASALDSLGWPLVYDSSDNTRGLKAFEESLELRRELGDAARVEARDGGDEDGASGRSHPGGRRNRRARRLGCRNIARRSLPLSP